MRKVLIRVSLVMLALFLAVSACSTGFWLGRATPTPLPASSSDRPQPAPTLTQENRDQLFTAFWQAWDIVHNQYVDQPVDDTALMRGAIKGMLEALGDQHTSYMDPQEYKDATTSLGGEYEGIGAWVNTDGEYLTISQPMPGSPAEKAGLKPGDQVVAIDGEDMTGVDPAAARLKVLGPKGTTVVLTIKRPGVEETFDVSVKRATIVVPSVTSRMLEGNIAYVQIFTFGENTGDELKTALQELMAHNPSGLILDLRNNGGGYLQTAVKVGSQFLEKDQVILYEQYGNGERNTYRAQGGGLATEIPMVVLVNQYSASASEILAGALQDYGRAQLVGVTTFGKGSVQNWVPLKDDQGAVRVTVARWLTPHERQIHQIGLEPNVKVELTEDDIKAERDPQLDRAIELLTQK